MKKLISSAAVIGLLGASSALAFNMMGWGSNYAGTGWSGWGMMGMGLLGTLIFVLGSFVFSIIFWGVYKWVMNKKKRR